MIGIGTEAMLKNDNKIIPEFIGNTVCCISSTTVPSQNTEPIKTRKKGKSNRD